MLSLFSTQEIPEAEWRGRFSVQGYLQGPYSTEGALKREVRERYDALIDLISGRRELIEGAGLDQPPPDPCYVACRLNEAGLEMTSALNSEFPRKSDFPLWPDRRNCPL